MQKVIIIKKGLQIHEKNREKFVIHTQAHRLLMLQFTDSENKNKKLVE